MVSNAEWAEYRQGNAQIRRLLERDIRQLWQAVDPSDRARFRQVILDNVPFLVDEYGKISASLAAEFFEATVGRTPLVAAPVAHEVVEASARWAIGPAFDDKPQKALGLITGSMVRHARQPGRDTVRMSSLDSRGVGYARVLVGDTNCAFCVVMAGRGVTYESSESGDTVVGRGGAPRKGHTRALGDDYHDKCNCEVIAVSSPDDWPPGYDHEKYEKMYEDARDTVDSNALKGGKAGVPREKVAPADMSILQYMRETHGLH